MVNGKQKIHYETNKDTINEKAKETMTWETCGVCVRKSDEARRERSQRHIDALETPQ